MSDIEEQWRRAVEQTTVIRTRVQSLSTNKATRLPYIFLAASSLNHGDTVVRQGTVQVTPPSIVLPPFSPQFEDFPMDEERPIDHNSLVNFLLIRGVSFPSMKYQHQSSHTLDIFEGALDQAISHYANRLERMEDVLAGLITGPEDCWQWSVLLCVGSLVERSAPDDVQAWIERLRRQLPGRGNDR